MLSPKQRAELVETLRLSEESNRAEAALLLSMGCDESAEDFSEQADEEQAIITALANEAALAEQVRVLREALEVVRDLIETTAGIRTMSGSSPRWEEWDGLNKIRVALALPVPEAVKQAAENAERAGLLEWWFTESNEAARNRIRDKRTEAGDQWPEYQWTAEEWIAEVRAAKEAGNG